MKWWVENYWHDFHNNASLLSKLLEFNDLIKSHGFIQECQSLEESMLSQVFFFFLSSFFFFFFFFSFLKKTFNISYNLIET